MVVVTQKVVSKAEDKLVPIDPTDPLSHKPLVEAESVRILRRRGELIISETKHGFVCANAGIDLSNVEQGYASGASDYVTKPIDGLELLTKVKSCLGA